MKKIGYEVIAGVISGVVLIAIPFLFDSVKKFYGKIFKFLTSEVSVPTWLASICLILLIFYLVRTSILYIRMRSRSEWIAYKKDIFEGIVWEWDYSQNNQVINLSPYCAEDSTHLVYEYIGMYRTELKWVCETCKRRYGPFKGDIDYCRSAVLRQIDRKIRSNSWKEVASQEKTKPIIQNPYA